MKPCSDPHCRCHIKERNGVGWRFGAPSGVEHGTAGCYAQGCREPQCRDAATRHRRKFPRKTKT